MSEPANLAEAFRDRTEALDALGRAIVAEFEANLHLIQAQEVPEAGMILKTHDAWRQAAQALEDAECTYYWAHRTVQKFLNGDASE